MFLLDRDKYVDRKNYLHRFLLLINHLEEQSTVSSTAEASPLIDPHATTAATTAAADAPPAATSTKLLPVLCNCYRYCVTEYSCLPEPYTVRPSKKHELFSKQTYLFLNRQN
jgi:hypothetical protein